MPKWGENAMRNLLFKVEDQVCDDAMQLDEPDGKFDTVFSFGDIHHLEEWRKRSQWGI